MSAADGDDCPIGYGSDGRPNGTIIHHCGLVPDGTVTPIGAPL